MGYITNFVVAPQSALRALLADNRTPRRSEGFEASFAVETFELARLWCLLQGEDSEEAFFRRVAALDEAYVENAEGGWAVALPIAFVREMAALADGKAATATEAWVRSDEIEGIPHAEVEQLVSDLRALAAQAVQIPDATIIVRVAE